MQCLYPATMAEALAALARTPGAVPVAGCTDFYPALGQKPLIHDILDLTGLAEARGVRIEADHTRIGALTSWSELITSDLPPVFAALKEAAAQVGGVQIQNAGTIGGNLCNASPAADGVPPLLALDAEVELCGAAGTRRLALQDFLLGNRRTCRAPGEIMTAILVPKRAPRAVSVFLKLGARKYLVISIAMVAVMLEGDEAGRVGQAAIAVGACSAVAQRLGKLEAALRGRPLDSTLAHAISPAHLEPLSPIDDLRGTAAYRGQAVLALLRRALDEAAGRARNERSAA